MTDVKRLQLACSCTLPGVAAGLLRSAAHRAQVEEDCAICSDFQTAALQIHVDEKHTGHVQAALQRTFYSGSTDSNFQESKQASVVIVRPERRVHDSFARTQYHHPIGAESQRQQFFMSTRATCRTG